MSAVARRWTVSLPCLLSAALVLVCAVPNGVLAQVLYGSILGDVKDASGASMPGIAVVVTNKNTSLTREAVTDQAGRFNFPDLSQRQTTASEMGQISRHHQRAGSRPRGIDERQFRLGLRIVF